MRDRRTWLFVGEETGRISCSAKQETPLEGLPSIDPTSPKEHHSLCTPSKHLAVYQKSACTSPSAKKKKIAAKKNAKDGFSLLVSYLEREIEREEKNHRK